MKLILDFLINLENIMFLFGKFLVRQKIISGAGARSQGSRVVGGLFCEFFHFDVFCGYYSFVLSCVVCPTLFLQK